jgi:RnfABCDGE-type electron transport complex B subunit
MAITLLIVSIGSKGGIGLVLALLLVLADRRLAVKEDPHFEEALTILPGLDCGACGYPQCAAYLGAVMEEEAEPNLCKPGGPDVAFRLAAFLGIEAGDSVRQQIARVRCSGGDREALRNRVYDGVRSCAAANLVGGEKACLYSCLGFGECVDACPFDAIHMGDNGLPVVDLVRCTGCGKCVVACPRAIITLADYDEAVHVYCISRDKGAEVRKICSAGCIACKLCEKDDTTGAVSVTDNLAEIDFSVHKAPIDAVHRCPTKVIRISEAVPGYIATETHPKKLAP